MGRELRIENDEAYAMAHRLADQQGVSPAEVVLAALKAYAASRPRPSGRIAAEYAAETRAALDAAIAATWGPDGPPRDATSDHSWLYDERGLPR